MYERVAISLHCKYGCGISGYSCSLYTWMLSCIHYPNAASPRSSRSCRTPNNHHPLVSATTPDSESRPPPLDSASLHQAPSYQSKHLLYGRWQMPRLPIAHWLHWLVCTWHWLLAKAKQLKPLAKAATAATATPTGWLAGRAAE